VILEKIYGKVNPKSFKPLFFNLFKGLNVEFEILGVINSWLSIEVSGEDLEVAEQILKSNFGIAPVDASKIKRFECIKGRVLTEVEDGFIIDIGVFKPNPVKAFIPLWKASAQLTDGKKTNMKILSSLFCLVENIPVEVRLLNVLENGFVEAEFHEKFLNKIKNWILDGLDRLIVIGATLKSVKKALKSSRHIRDIVFVESLGLLEHAIVCKLGTDAVGLIPRIGNFLPDAKLAVFSPREIIRSFGKDFFLYF